ncbi:MAG: GntR family transcriptional regulator [Anaerolineae bacterium]
MLDKSAGTPLHIQLTDTLRHQILVQRQNGNDRLPSERELCHQFGVSRITVRRAMSQLQRENLIYTTVGKGTFVAVPELTEELQPLSSFTQDMKRRGLAASSRVLEALVLNSDDELATRLRIPRGAEVVKLFRLRLAEGAPVAIQCSWLPHHLCPDILQLDLSSKSLFDVLKSHYALGLAHAETSIEAALAGPEERELLQLPNSAAVLISEQTTVLDSGAIIEYVRSVFRGDRYRLFIHM